jgi:hypothetical protein
LQNIGDKASEIAGPAAKFGSATIEGRGCARGRDVAIKANGQITSVNRITSEPA